jgi:hypothetical protein
VVNDAPTAQPRSHFAQTGKREELHLIYVFPGEAKPDLKDMYVVRDHLNDMGLRARRLAQSTL